MMNLAELNELVRAAAERATALRHRLHEIPEIAGGEVKTAALLRQELEPLQLRLLSPFLGTDVVALLETGRPGKNIALRADMDALPIEEVLEHPYKSQHPGMMHACGHDGHMAMLYGAALVLDRLRDQLRGTVRFVFQPGEEVAAMGRLLVEAGALEDPAPDLVTMLHGWPELPVGVIGSMPGPVMAAASHFYLTITGKGVHGSTPENGIDPLRTACLAVDALQTVPSCRFPARETVVVTVCSFHAGCSSNVIPNEAELSGTTRTLSPKVVPQIEAKMREVLDGVCRITGAAYDFRYEQNYHVTVNDPAAFAHLRKATERYLGEANFALLKHPTMGAEDFSFYLERYPGAMARIGVGTDAPKLHNNRFDFNDGAIANGILYFVGFVLEAMEEA